MGLKFFFGTIAVFLILFSSHFIFASPIDVSQSLDECIEMHILSQSGCEDDIMMQALGLSNELEKLSLNKICIDQQDGCKVRLKILEEKFDILLPSLQELASSDYKSSVPLHIENSVRIMTAIQEKIDNLTQKESK